MPIVHGLPIVKSTRPISALELYSALEFQRSPPGQSKRRAKELRKELLRKQTGLSTTAPSSVLAVRLPQLSVRVKSDLKASPADEPRRDTKAEATKVILRRVIQLQSDLEKIHLAACNLRDAAALGVVPPAPAGSPSTDVKSDPLANEPECKKPSQISPREYFTHEYNTLGDFSLSKGPEMHAELDTLRDALRLPIAGWDGAGWWARMGLVMDSVQVLIEGM
ncbi:hypothetical protein MKEN_00202000 [Mycena kentingensis (nom. inval.)]|nr:hypothetical protein MKEN_00202000 [Mycena kentingensis (nom. inval.)]